MDREEIKKYYIIAVKVVSVTLFVTIVMSVFLLEAAKKPQEEIESILTEKQRVAEAILAGKQVNENLPEIWPPKMNEPYPNMDLIDQDGHSIKVSDLEGRIVVVEYVDMSSPVSQAQSGAAKMGVFGSAFEYDEDAKTIYEAYNKRAQQPLSFPNDNIIELKIIVYNEAGGQASRDDATNWADHFGFEKGNLVVVAVPEKDIRGGDVDEMIGGYQLLDRRLNLRVDSSGLIPKHNLDMTLVPLMEKLI